MSSTSTPPERARVIAIDGPAGSGKSTVARLLAARLDWTFVDTGALYRCVALAARQAGVAPDDQAGLAALVARLRVEFAWSDSGVPAASAVSAASSSAGSGRPAATPAGLPAQRVLLDGQDVSAAIRAPEISAAASTYSAAPAVRAGLLDLQRRLAGSAGAVLEGRDIGTVVFPDAAVKFFLDADPAERARRRTAELAGRGVAADRAAVQAELAERDARDAQRAVAPLRPAPDALRVDTTGLDIEQVVGRLLELAGPRL